MVQLMVLEYPIGYTDWLTTNFPRRGCGLVDQAHRLMAFLDAFREAEFDDLEIAAAITVLLPDRLGDRGCLSVIPGESEFVVRLVEDIDLRPVGQTNIKSPRATGSV